MQTLSFRRENAEVGGGDFRREVSRKAKRMREARSAKERLWAGLALVGSVGWMITLPMLGGLFLGRYLDDRLDTNLAFTLGLLILGLAAGAYGAWRFVIQEGTQ